MGSIPAIVTEKFGLILGHVASLSLYKGVPRGTRNLEDVVHTMHFYKYQVPLVYMVVFSKQ